LAGQSSQQQAGIGTATATAATVALSGQSAQRQGNSGTATATSSTVALVGQSSQQQGNSGTVDVSGSGLAVAISGLSAQQQVCDGILFNAAPFIPPGIYKIFDTRQNFSMKPAQKKTLASQTRRLKAVSITTKD
jgi:hypothetical protein